MHKEITIEDKTATEQASLIAELDEKYKNIVIGKIETMLTKKNLKTSFKIKLPLCKCKKPD